MAPFSGEVGGGSHITNVYRRRQDYEVRGIDSVRTSPLIKGIELDIFVLLREVDAGIQNSLVAYCIRWLNKQQPHCATLHAPSQILSQYIKYTTLMILHSQKYRLND